MYKEDSKVYKKVGRRYEPIGTFYNRDWLNDGIWYVRTNGSRITNGSYLEGLFKISDKPLFDNFARYCDLADVADKVLNDKDFNAKLNLEKGYSISDIVHLTIACLEKYRQEDGKN